MSHTVIVGATFMARVPQKNFICADLETGPRNGRAGIWQGVFGHAGRREKPAHPDGWRTLVLAAADPRQYRELGRLQVCGKNWNFPAYAGREIYVSRYHELLCLDLAH